MYDVCTFLCMLCNVSGTFEEGLVFQGVFIDIHFATRKERMKICDFPRLILLLGVM